MVGIASATIAPSRTRTVVYWTATAFVVGELGLGGVWDLMRIPYVRGLVEHLGYPTYFLTVADIVDLIKEHGVRAAARGSGAGSLVTYLLGISARTVAVAASDRTGAAEIATAEEKIAEAFRGLDMKAQAVSGAAPRRSGVAGRVSSLTICRNSAT